MKKYLNKPLLLLVFMAICDNFAFGQGKVVTVPPINGTTTWGAITFNLRTTALIRVDTIFVNTSGASGTVNLELWYKSTPINGQPVTADFTGGTPTWTNIISTQAVPAGMDLAPIVIPGGFLMPANSHYGFYIGDPAFSNTGIRYASSGTIDSVTDGTITIRMGTNVGYGWVRSGTTTNHPRWFAGGVRYSPGLKGINDAGVVKVNKPTNFCSGTQDIEVQISNAGNNRLDSVRINWELNGVLQNTIYHTSLIDTVGGGSSFANILLGSHNFSSGVSASLKVWTSHPNGAVDTANKNDTLYATLKPALNGIYTIGGANPDYASFTDAAADLNALGVCGPVTFRVRAGSYNERITLGDISGSSAVNTISFIGAGKNTTRLSYAGTDVNDFATVLLNGTDHVHFRDMSIAASDDTYGVGILLTNKADSNSFRNMNIQLSTSATATTTAGIAVTGSLTSVTANADAGNFNTFDSLNVSGGYYGININGTSTAIMSTGNKVLNSTFTSQYYYGIRPYYQKSITLTNNKVNGFRNTTAYGMYVYYCSDYTVGNNNVTSPYEALRLYYCDKYQMSGKDTSRTYNNILVGNAYYTLYAYYSDDVNFYHNTVISNGGYASNAYFATCARLDARNNIFINRNTGATSHAVYITGGSQDYLDYNVYYGFGGTYVYHTLARADLAAWKTAFPTLNVHSLTASPVFVSASDFHLKPGGPNYTGSYVGIDKDIDGNRRSVVSPTIGADEKIRTVNNAGVNAITSPVNFCSGSYDVKVEIENSGTNRIDSVRVNWELNGVLQSPIYVTTALDTFGGAGSPVREVLLGNLAFTGTGKSFKIWTSHPNGVPDTANDNDTLYQVLKSSLTGTYTVGGANPDFTSLADAVSDLNDFGVCGPVTFNIRAGTYNERITLGEIRGASAVNTISFAGADKNTTILSYGASSTTDLATVLLNGTDHVSFRNMTVAGTGLTYGVGILLTGKADSNTFRNMNIRMNNASTSANTAGVAISATAISTTGTGDAGNYNTFDSLDVSGAYYGITFTGTGTSTAHCYGNKVLNSTLTGQYYYGIRAYYQNEFIIDNNKVDNMRNTTAYGLYIYYSSDYTVSNNNVVSPYEAMYLYYGDKYLMSGTGSNVYNNMLQGDKYYTLYAYYTDDMNFYHNTVVNKGSYANNAYFSGCARLDIRNNIFVNENAGATSNAIYITGGSVDDLDYNVYYSAGSTFVYHTVAYANMSAWRAAFPTFNANSYRVNPLFLSPADIHLSANSPVMKGTDVGIVTDIDGDVRCELQTTIGADEPSYNLLNPIAGFSMQDSIFEQSPTQFLNTSTAIFNEPLGYQWYIDGAVVSTQKDIFYTFNAPGIYQVSLKARNCSGFDSIASRVEVVAPLSTPEPDFIASSLVINASPLMDTVHLYDMSSHGASSWDWTINPSLGVSFDPNAANPEVLFSTPGYYDICLTAGNALGTSATKCKQAYIYVNDEQWMGNLPSTSMPGGRISDDGWIGNYQSYIQSIFLINPDSCAAEIKLKFTLFSLADFGDSLRVFDGEDNNGVLLGEFSAGSSLPGGTAGLTAYSGKMYLEWVTNGSGEAEGFEAYWSTVADTSKTLPVAGFSYAPAIYTNTEVVLTSTSNRVRYAWDMAPPTMTPDYNGGNKKEARYTWGVAGTYDVKLQVRNCVGIDSITKQITIMDPVSSPVIGFYADKVRVPAHTTVKFYDTSDQGPTAWTWSVNPAPNAFFENGNHVKNPRITFYAPGSYEVQLKASNAIGEDSLVKTAYIEVFDYCTPAVGLLNPDIGISRVKLGNIDNHTTIGQRPHSKYLTNFAPEKLYQRASYEMTIERTTASDSMSRKVWIDLNGNGDFTDAGELVLSEAAGRTLSYTQSFTIPTGNFTGYTVMRIGTSYGQGKNAPCGINPIGEFEDYPVEILIDNIAPVITLNGTDTVYTEQWYAYADAGATALDNIDGIITSSVLMASTVDSSITGTYAVTYQVSDLAGNAASPVTRTVIVTPDITAPIIALTGSSSRTHRVGTAYIDSGAVATDYFNRNLSASLVNGNNVNENVLGTYYYYYTVQDASGNKDSVTRTVIVIDDVDPVLTFIGTDTVTMEVFGAINDPGVDATDNYYAGVAVTVDSSKVNGAVTGNYVMVYTGTDSSGNVVVLNRIVKVKDTQAPVIVLKDLDTLETAVFDKFNDPGVTIQDNYCAIQTWQVTSTLDTAVLGEYTITYHAVDCEGNIALPVQRVVKVVDNTAPVVVLDGSEFVTVNRWAAYTDAGITVNDNYYPLSQLTIDTLGTWESSDLEEVYYIQYRVTDPSGNIGYSAKRIIDVRGSNSISDPSAMEIKLYPNPTTGRFTIRTQGALTTDALVTITDLAGKQITAFTLPAGMEEHFLDLGSYSPGTYMVIMKAGTAISTAKVIVTR